MTSRLRGLAVLGSLVLAFFGTTGCESRISGAVKTGAASSKAAARYVCPMHPEQSSDKPGDCAVCGMKLVAAEQAGMAEPDPAAPSGLAAIHVSAEAQKQMGLTLAAVERHEVHREIRTPARIVADQSRVVRMSCPADGWVDKLWVNGIGEKIRKGDRILELYSADGLVTFRQNLALLGREATPEIARHRLERWGLGEAQIDKLMQPGSKIDQFLILTSPLDGFVAEKTVMLGQRLTAGESLIVVADLSRVWAEIDLFESDIPWVKVGMTATVTFSYWPGKEFRGRVTVVNPFLDRETRTLRARLEIDNRLLELRPEMFGTAHMTIGLGERLVVPEAAVMRTGERDYAFRAGQGDRIDPVELKLGTRADGAWEVLSGLESGDRVVASANFLVDSESALKSALQAVSSH